MYIQRRQTLVNAVRLLTRDEPAVFFYTYLRSTSFCHVCSPFVGSDDQRLSYCVTNVVVVLPPRRRSLLPFRGEAVSGAKVLHFYETAVIQFTGIDAQLAELALNQSS